MKANVLREQHYDSFNPPMSANHISIPTRAKAGSWNRNGLVQRAAGVAVPFVFLFKYTG